MSGPALVAQRLTSTLDDGTTVLAGVSLRIEPGEFVAIIGRSGAGKTTLLDTLAGLRIPTGGWLELCGEDRLDGEPAESMVAAYVPQDDIVHADLSVEATIRYAARLRLPPGTTGTEIDAVVERVLWTLDLADRRHLLVRSLSGGQRKRASIATELVMEPHLCFLDEPTVSLDPDSSARLVDVLRGLADAGTTVIMTTHDVSLLGRVDRLVVLADGGRLVYDGPPGTAAAHFDVEDLLGLYRALWSLETSPAPATHDVERSSRSNRATHRRIGAAAHVWRVLARRNLELMARNRMSAVIMLGSPLLVVGMFALLFQPGAFGSSGPNPTASIAIAYWIAFAAFFFGLTFGLLQICSELPIVRRERFGSVDVGPYLLAKVTVLGPALAGVNIVMVATLTAFGRLPAFDLDVHGPLLAILLFDSAAGLALGLLASASVTNSAQAALALPMLCFPAVLFSGAVLPVRSMAPVGRLFAALTSDRWAFEGVAGVLDLDGVLGRTPLGGTIAAEHGAAFSRSPLTASLVLAAFVAFSLVTAWKVIDRRTSPSAA